jgi:hypothetical protein
MKKYKFLVFIIPLIFALLSFCGESKYSLAAEPSLLGTWIGSVKEVLSDYQFQLTIVITNDTETALPGKHTIEGTIALTGFPLCFTQGLFSSETGLGRWSEQNYSGSILAIGEDFSQAYLTLDISTDLMQIRILGGGGSGFWDINGNICLLVDSGSMTKQAAQYCDFSANPTTGPAPLTVNFTDESTGSITSWEWDFGDGSTNTIQNPSHTYTDPGTYTVTLTVTGPEGSDTETRSSYIKVTSSAKAMPWLPLLLFDE